MTSQHAKVAVLDHLVSYSSSVGVFTETLWACDVLALRRSLYTIDFEVKVTKQDLVNEIRCANAAFENGYTARSKVYNISKLYKHACYLGRASRRYTPNEFYFVVPFDLLAVVVDELRVPGYGIATIADGYLTFQRIAKKLHKTKIGLADMLPLLRKATTENAVLRRKLLEATTPPMVE